MTRDAMHFWAVLLNKKPRRIRFSRADLLQAFGCAFPHSQADLNIRERLSAVLSELAESGLLRLPRVANRRGYDHSEKTPIPQFVNRLDFPKAKIGANFWRPELAFAQNLPRFWHDELMAIQNWLRNCGASAQFVALRERSVEIFGDEKRLDSMLGTKLFAPGCLSLDLLKCYLPTVPIYVETIEHDERLRPFLIVENHTTFDTLRRWNEQQKRYSAIAYGAGTSFISSSRSLMASLQLPGCSGIALYFGDVDPKGLWIPARASQECGIKILPDRTLYEMLFQKAREMWIVTHTPFPFQDGLIDWLPEDLRAAAIECFNAGRRLPQEILSIWDLGACSAE